MKTLKRFFPKPDEDRNLKRLHMQYRAQVKQDAQYMNQPIKFIFIIFIISETLRALLGEALFEGPIRWNEIFPRVAYFLLITTTILGDHLVKNLPRSSFFMTFRRLIVALGIIIYCGVTAVVTFWRVDDFAYYYKDYRDKFDFMSFGLIMVSNIMISDVIFSKWLYKVVIPVSELSALACAVIRSDPMNCWALLSYLFTLILYVVANFWAKDRLAWGVFLHRRRLSEWNQIHQEIFKNIPDNIAVYGFNRDVLFENEHYKQLKKDMKDTDLLEAVANVKKRKDPNFFEQDHQEHREHTEHESLSQQSTIENLNTKTFENLAQLLETVQTLYGEHKIDNKGLMTFDGKYYNHSTKETHSIEIKLVVFEDPQGDGKKLLLILRDTTQRDLISVLESNNKFKDNVIDSVSHELRTPLNGLRSMLDLCKEDLCVPEDVKKNYIRPASTSAAMLNHIVDDILDYSLLLKNKLAMKLQKVNVVSLLYDCHKLVRSQYGQPNITFSLDIDERIPAFIRTDPDRLTRLATNLLSNAFKFTKTGVVLLKAKMEDRHLRVIIRDTGIGMSGETMHNLANISVQSLKGEKVSSTSTGVGLGITFSQYTSYLLGPNKMAGLYFTSQLHQGSLFTFLVENKELEPVDLLDKGYRKIPPLKILPQRALFNEDLIKIGNQSRDNSANNVSRPNQSLLFGNEEVDDDERLPEDTRQTLPDTREDYRPSKSSRWRSNQPQPKGPEILLVDDEPINVLALEMLFKQLNKPVDKAYGGEEALQLIERRKNEMRSLCPKVYQVIFMDLNMPAVDGFEATRRIKEKIRAQEIEDVVIVACTAYPEHEYKMKCLQAGMSEFLNKPVTKKKIIEILTKYNCV